MTVKDFANKHGLAYNAELDCIIGAHGIIKHSMNAMLSLEVKVRWKQAKEYLKLNNFVFGHDYEFHGEVLFLPDNQKQAELAIKLAVCQQTLITPPVIQENTQAAPRQKKIKGTI